MHKVNRQIILVIGVIVAVTAAYVTIVVYLDINAENAHKYWGKRYQQPKKQGSASLLLQ
jgi:hypothetical protein